MRTIACPFCDPDPGRVFLRRGRILALWDAFPVSPGHALIVPLRHVSTWFDASLEERAELYGAIDAVCDAIRARGPVDGFNFGINVGSAGGQTVPHLHLHVIPRRDGDMPDPRGGVRHVIPGKGNYLADRPAMAASVEDSTLAYPVESLDVGRSTPTDRDHDVPPTILTTGEDVPLLPLLEHDLARATRVDIAVAFVMPSGVERLHAHFDDLLSRGGSLRLVTGDYLDISDPDALQRLLDLRTLHDPKRFELRVFVTRGRSFHPKAYLLARDPDDGVAYVGSSNLSSSALTDGVEWNYRVDAVRDRTGLRHVRAAFAALFAHPQTQPLDSTWLDGYRRRRSIPMAAAAGDTDVAREPPLPVPTPNVVQQEALRALEATRAAGNRAGLVVMATGLGKTWLAAFDVARPEFRRVLFVAHREEILKQALATFRRIRPSASIGLYTGEERTPDADILFASVQTLSRRRHLDAFAPDAFDYIVVDEFHHAAAATYRRLIEHFDPAFMLGLTATPERSDGGDLLGLCGENLVYRCAVPRGIELELLCPYSYFGVPDEVDYANIPWRSTRFDEVALTEAVATRRRANNILEQWRKRGGERTIAFCVSQRHADFMRAFFTEHGVPCAAVHSGPGSDGRALSLERLAAGELKVVFAVDMFNEGVDVPAIDTVMMLRPTESQIVWLQQFGRGLRKLGDKRLTVVDYIGNHRSFLVKLRTLLAVQQGGDRELAAALRAAHAGELELPPGCEVTYELQALDILRALLRSQGEGTDALRGYYDDFVQRHGQRPTASETFRDGYLPRSARAAYGSWFGLVRAAGDLGPAELAMVEQCGPFLAGLEVTKMTRSYKMLVLLAMLNADALPGPGIDIARLCAEVVRLASRSTVLRDDIGADLSDTAAVRRMLETYPIARWTDTAAIPDQVAFEYRDGRFRYTGAVPEQARSAFQSMVRELVDWRLAEYLSRSAMSVPSETSFTMRVSHANGRPILFLPDRAVTAAIPEGWQDVAIDGEPHRANFVKVAVNVVRPAEGDENVLPELLRGWFGHDAGLPGTDHRVKCEASETGWSFSPVGVRGEDERPELFRRYSREQIPRLFGEQFTQAIWNAGFVVITPKEPKHLCLLVTLHKSDMDDKFQYGDKFLSPETFQWQSQNRTRQQSTHGALMRRHAELGVKVHLFVRATKKIGAAAAPFVYCGPVTFVDWVGEQPITVTWRLDSPLPERLSIELDH